MPEAPARGARGGGLALALAPANASAQEVTVYSSLPLEGASRPLSRDVVRGIRLASSGPAGAPARRPCATSRSTTPPGAPGRGRRGAPPPTRAARCATPRAVASIGEFGSGASAVSMPVMPAEAYPASGQEVMRARGPQTSTYGLYGYEAMSVVLDAIARGGTTRAGTVQALFATRDRDSVLGPYSVDANGDTTTTPYGVYRVSRRGELVFERAIDASS